MVEEIIVKVVAEIDEASFNAASKQIKRLNREKDGIVASIKEIFKKPRRVLSRFKTAHVELEMGNVRIHSDNTPQGTSVYVNGKILSVRRITWVMDAEEMFGELQFELTPEAASSHMNHSKVPIEPDPDLVRIDKTSLI